MLTSAAVRHGLPLNSAGALLVTSPFESLGTTPKVSPRLPICLSSLALQFKHEGIACSASCGGSSQLIVDEKHTPEWCLGSTH